MLSKITSSDLEKALNVIQIRLPKDFGIYPLVSGKVLFFKDGKNITHYRGCIPIEYFDLRVSLLRELGIPEFDWTHVGTYALSPLQSAKEILSWSCRTKSCTKCKETKLSDEFYWKKKGYEGPFPSLWNIGRRQSTCISCEAEDKVSVYKDRIKKLRLVKRCRPIKDRVVKVVDPRKMKVSEMKNERGFSNPSELKHMLVDFVSEVIINDLRT